MKFAKLAGLDMPPLVGLPRKDRIRCPMLIRTGKRLIGCSTELVLGSQKVQLPVERAVQRAQDPLHFLGRLIGRI